MRIRGNQDWGSGFQHGSLLGDRIDMALRLVALLFELHKNTKVLATDRNFDGRLQSLVLCLSGSQLPLRWPMLVCVLNMRRMHNTSKASRVSGGSGGGGGWPMSITCWNLSR